MTTLICHDPVLLPQKFDELSGLDRARLVRNPEEFRKTTSMLTVSISATAGSYDSYPTARLDLSGGRLEQSAHLRALSLSPAQLRIWKDQVKKLRLKADERLVLQVNPHYQIFVPKLVTEVNAENVREILDERQFGGLNLMAQMREPFSSEVARIEDFKRKAIAHYLLEPKDIYGYNQLHEALAGTTFATLMASSFAVFVKADQRSGFIISEDREYVAYCQRADQAPTIAEDLAAWLGSKAVRSFLSCAGQL